MHLIEMSWTQFEFHEITSFKHFSFIIFVHGFSLNNKLWIDDKYLFIESRKKSYRIFFFYNLYVPRSTHQSRASNTSICCHGQQSLRLSCIRIFPSIQLVIFLFGENFHKPTQCNVPKSVEFICYPCVMRIFAMQDALRQTTFALGQTTNLSTPFRWNQIE